MKKAIILLLLIAIIPLITFSQSIENIDYIAPFNDEVAAIKKDNQWGFINLKGDLVVKFRDDLVSTKSDDGNYPVFHNGRCLIKQEKEGISYFGYIDTLGNAVVEPQYLNATNFKKNVAIALKLMKVDGGKNEILGKNVIYYKYYVTIIDTEGMTMHYLTPDGINVILDKEFLKEPPEISYQLIADNLYATKGKNGKWTINRIE